MAGDRLLDSRDFDPFWSEAERLNIPVYVHIGFESPTFTGLFQNLFMAIAFSNRASLLMGFLAIVGTGSPTAISQPAICFCRGRCRVAAVACSCNGFLLAHGPRPVQERS